MATWQFDLHLLPRIKLIQLFSQMPSHLERDIFDAVGWWDSHQPPADYQARLTSFLPESSHWSNSARRWGSEESHLVEAWFEAGRVQEFFVRIDARAQADSFILGLADFAKYCGCLIYTENDEILDHTFASITSAFFRSNAFRFVSSPAAFLENLKETPVDIHGRLKGLEE